MSGVQKKTHRPGQNGACQRGAGFNGHTTRAFNWSCLLIAFENRLKVPIRAGEKIFPGVLHE
jgi:hypothetical protein